MEIVFKTPFMLLLLLLIPLLIILHYYFFEHNKKKAMKFANFTALKRVTGTHLITKNTAQLILRVIIVIFIILSSAQPVIWYKGKESITDYVIAIDASASMISGDVLPDRLTVAKQAATSFINSLDAQTNVGLISFAGVSFVKLSPTKDLRQVKEAINQLEIELAGGTDIGAALVTSTNLLNPGKKSKAVILITDGSDTAGTFVEESLNTALEYVANNQIIVYTIGIGTGSATAGYLGDTNLKATVDKDTFEMISTRTGGKYYEIENTAEIAAAFHNIGNLSEEAQVAFDSAFLLLAIAFLLLFVEWGLLNTRFRAIP